MLTEKLRSKLGDPPSLTNAVKEFVRELLQGALDVSRFLKLWIRNSRKAALPS